MKIKRKIFLERGPKVSEMHLIVYYEDEGEEK
jgi:hypothetical protein